MANEIPHEAYKRTHRTPRMLVVATEPVSKDIRIYPLKSFLSHGLDCYCTKFPVKGDDALHVLTPSESQTGALQSIKDAFDCSVESGKPYDIIVIDNLPAAQFLLQWVKDFDPRPGVLLHCRSEEEARTLRAKTGMAVIGGSEIVDNPVMDREFEKALGAEGVARLACKEGEQSALEQYATSTHNFTRLAPAGGEHRLRAGSKTQPLVRG